MEKASFGPLEWKALEREIEIMKDLDHPNVLKMYAVFQTDSQYHIVLD